MKTLAEQLHAAMKARGWSVPQLLKESQLKCDRTSLQRKLTGKQKLSTDEAEALTRILDVTIAWAPESAKAS